MQTMLQSVKNLVLFKNARNKYLNPEQLGDIQSYVRRASAELEAARILSQKSDVLTEQATKAVYEKFPFVY